MRNFVPLTLGDMLEDNAARFGDRPAYVYAGQTLSHGQLLANAKRLASALARRGVRRQDRVAILSMNSLEYGEVLAASEWSGIIVATVNFRLAPPEMAYIINNSSPRVLIFESQYLAVIDKLRPELASVETYVCIGGESTWAQSYDEFIASGDAAGPGFKAREEDIYCLVYTSGTTGKPKGCILGQREVRMGAQTLSTEIRGGPSDSILLVMPLFHVGAMHMGQSVHFRGGAVVLLRQFDPATLLKTVAGERITVLHLAPTLLQMVLDTPEVDKTDFSSVRTVVYSAAAMPVSVLKRGIEVLGNVFVNLYGLTEVFCSGLARELHRPDGSARERNWLTSVGHPFPNTLIKIIDDGGEECKTDVLGEIVVKSVAMARGYWNNHAATLESFRDGWCFTGDVGKFDADGLLYLVDRKKDVIISGGENIYSREVEDAVLAHPSVSECAVIGVPDSKWGESVCAVVVLRSGRTATEGEIIEHSRTFIAGFKKPRSVVFVSELPKLPTGKINKVELRKSARRPG